MHHKIHNRQHPLTNLQASAAHHPDTPGKYISTLLHLILILLTATLTSQAQWDIEESHTTASLRGIHNVGGGVAWASGTNGTVLRTEDGGYLWQTCNIPPGAEKLDFRGIQAFDENTAIVMSSGPGDQSRLYKTTDGCQTWKLLFTNPDKDGFWDAIQFSDQNFGVLVGDPVQGKIYSRSTSNGGASWRAFEDDRTLQVGKLNAGFFAASNSSLVLPPNPNIILAAANIGNSAILLEAVFGDVCGSSGTKESRHKPAHCPKGFSWQDWGHIPFSLTGKSDGVFSLAITPGWTDDSAIIVAIGGDYLKPESAGTAAFAREFSWEQAVTPPHGYRSSVAYDPTQKLWITVGPNGTDITTDDGRNWRPLKPSPTDPPDADQNWNALSLPFVVGPKGRIGKLRTLKP